MFSARSPGAPGAEEPLENQARIGFGGDGRGRGTPGKIELVGAGVTGIASAGIAHRIAAEFERREARKVANLARDGLVDGNAGADVGRALLQAHAGQEHAVAARVIAAAVLSAVGAALVESAQHLQVLA